MTTYLLPPKNIAAPTPYFSAKQLDQLDHGIASTWLGETTYHAVEQLTKSLDIPTHNGECG